MADQIARTGRTVPDSGRLSGSTQAGQDRTPPYRGVRLSGCPAVGPGPIPSRQVGKKGKANG
jgi:ribosomal protein L27